MSARAVGDLDRLTLEAALFQSEQVTRGILEAVPAGVVLVLADGSIPTANAEALRLLGLTFDELTDRYAHDFEAETVFEDGTPCPAGAYPVTHALATGEPQPSTTIGMRRPDGSTVWCVFRAVPLKDPTSGTVTGAVATFHDVTDRIEAAQTLRTSEAKLKAIVTSAPNIIFTLDLDCRFTFMNRLQTDLHAPNLSTESIVGVSLFAWINERDHDRVRAAVKRVVEDRETVEYEVPGLDNVDPNFYVTRIGPILSGDEVVAIAGVVSTVTERKRAEQERVRLLEQLHEARRLEALGRLAGGVAHDFNNLLTVIRGNVDLMLAASGRAVDPLLESRAREIGAAASKAGALTRQLLAFGRQQPLQPRLLDLTDVVSEIAPMLRRLLGEDIELEVQGEKGLASVRADPIEIDRVLVNLVTNARDAMTVDLAFHKAPYREATPRKCIVATRSVVVAPGTIDGVGPGAYVELSVRDTGAGMDAETLAHLFEPFFTTKPLGHHSGLGLATVHGIVKQTGGSILVETNSVEENMCGATFRVLLPAVAEKVPARPSSRQRLTVRGTETILLVEDDLAVRRTTKAVLEVDGYTVIEAESPEWALAVDDATLARVDLLVTDVVMPRVGGPVLASELQARSPRLRVLFVSGHVSETIGVPGSIALASLPSRSSDVHFLSKPFSGGALASAVRQALGQPAPTNVKTLRS